MGIRSSRASEGGDSPTVKVILDDGTLLELVGPARASQLLSKSSESFVCDADDMEFDGYVAAMGAKEELRSGQLYFVLPLSMLKRRMHPEEMAALAIRASSALLEGGSAAAFGSSVEEERWEERGRRAVAPVGGFSIGAEVEGRRHRRRSRGGRNFTSKLGAIAE